MLTLVGKTNVTGNVWTFEFEPSSPLTWTAGQFIKVSLPHPADAEGPSRRFTIAAAPYEKTLKITTRITGSTFKQALAALPVGGRLTLLDAPAGDFVWRAAPLPHLFVAHGIGITPFLAIVKDRRHRGLPVSAHLFYTNRPGTEPLFKTELAGWAEADPSFTVSFESEPATPALLAGKFPDLARRYIYASGPKPLITLCMPPYNLPASQLLQDNFPGYPASVY